MHRIILFFLITMICITSRACALQDEMAVGKFLPTKRGWQVIIFHFENGKTHVRFFEKLEASPYMFPLYDVMLRGQLLEPAVIEDKTNDDMLEIYYQTNAEKGIIYFDREKKKLLNVHPKKGEKPRISFKDELKLLDND